MPESTEGVSEGQTTAMSGEKLVYDVRDIWPDVALEMGSFAENSIYCKVFRAITRFMYKHADWVTTVSPGKVEKIKNHVISVGGKKGGPDHVDKVKLVGNGFDESVENSSIDKELIAQYELDKKFTCVYVGNIGLAQGLGALLDMAEQSKHKEVQFLLFGNRRMIWNTILHGKMTGAPRS